MSHLDQEGPSAGRHVAKPLLCLAIAGLVGAVLTGCEVDSYIDPSVIGRWEHTPTVVPILESLPIIEDATGPLIEYSEVTSDDLVPVVEQYRIGAGDDLEVVLWDIPVQGSAAPYDRTVDSRGFIDLPQLGQIYLDRMTVDQSRLVIAQAVQAAELVADPLVDVVVRGRRQLTFNVMGAVANAGPYFIPVADFRLLDGLATAGGFAESSDEILVIRQVALASEVEGRSPVRPSPVDATDPTGNELIDIIDSIGGDDPEPGILPGRGILPGMLRDDRVVTGSRRRQPTDPPPIDLVEPTQQPDNPPENVDPPAAQAPWVFLNGEWVRAVRNRPSQQQPGLPEAATTSRVTAADDLVTQRVIRIPVDPLLAGDAKFNIILRPGDLVRVPSPESGNVYLAGQVGRPGVYQLPPSGKLTLTRAVTAAGGLSGTAIPDRVDLIRMVGDNRQATIRLNLRAIEEGTQPDVFLKPDDRINVGTNFWALPLAVVRNGFRATYGFGFLLDRNFGNDVFGPPPRSAGF